MTLLDSEKMSFSKLDLECVFLSLSKSQRECKKYNFLTKQNFSLEERPKREFHANEFKHTSRECV